MKGLIYGEPGRCLLDKVHRKESIKEGEKLRVIKTLDPGLPGTLSSFGFFRNVIIYAPENLNLDKKQQVLLDKILGLDTDFDFYIYPEKVDVQKPYIKSLLRDKRLKTYECKRYSKEQLERVIREYLGERTITDAALNEFIERCGYLEGEGDIVRVRNMLDTLWDKQNIGIEDIEIFSKSRKETAFYVATSIMTEPKKQVLDRCGVIASSEDFSFFSVAGAMEWAFRVCHKAALCPDDNVGAKPPFSLDADTAYNALSEIQKAKRSVRKGVNEKAAFINLINDLYDALRGGGDD